MGLIDLLRKEMLFQEAEKIIKFLEENNLLEKTEKAIEEIINEMAEEGAYEVRESSEAEMERLTQEKDDEIDELILEIEDLKEELKQFKKI
ncbi:MAG: hypothetical protein ACRC6O_13310 [Flavobacterium sp.]